MKVRSNGKYMKICAKATYECDYSEFKSLIRKSMTAKSIDEMCGKPIKKYIYEDKQEPEPELTDPFFVII